MAKTHTVFNGTHASFWDVDALNLVGIATTEIDNGMFLKLGDMSPNADGAYEFAVTADATDGEYIAGTPAQGYGVDAQVYTDPRYFTNEIGKPISVKHLVKGDCIEITQMSDITLVANQFAKVAAGKLTPAATNTDNTAVFKVLSTTSTMDIGGELVPTWILMKLV